MHGSQQQETCLGISSQDCVLYNNSSFPRHYCVAEAQYIADFFLQNLDTTERKGSDVDFFSIRCWPSMIRPLIGCSCFPCAVWLTWWSGLFRSPWRFFCSLAGEVIQDLFLSNITNEANRRTRSHSFGCYYRQCAQQVHFVATPLALTTGFVFLRHRSDVCLSGTLRRRRCWWRWRTGWVLPVRSESSLKHAGTHIDTRAQTYRHTDRGNLS